MNKPGSFRMLVRNLRLGTICVDDFDIGDEVLCIDYFGHPSLKNGQKYIVDDVRDMDGAIKIAGIDDWQPASAFQKVMSKSMQKRMAIQRGEDWDGK